MASQEHDTDDIHEETPGYKLSQPKQSLAEYQQMEQQQQQQQQQQRQEPDLANGQHVAPSSAVPFQRPVTVLRVDEPCWILLTLASPLLHPQPTRLPACKGMFAGYPYHIPHSLLIAIKTQSEDSTILYFAVFWTLTMSASGIQDGSISLAVPAPPPPSPRRDVYSNLNTPVTAIDLDELLRLLCLKANVVLPTATATAAATAAASTDLTPAPTYTLTPASAPTPTPSEHLLPPSGPDSLTLEGPGTNADAGDESLQRYKLSLGLGGGKDLSDPNDPRVAIIQSLAMETPGRDPVTIDLSVPGTEATLKDHPFKIKEGARFTMVATFKVQHEVLSGLRYVQIVKRKGIKVSKDSEMIGSYAPNTDKQPLYTKRFQEDEAPTGMLARGHYNAFSSFVDDDKKSHLEFEWSFDISKDW